MKLLSGILGLTLTSVVAVASANAADMYRGSDGGYKDGPVYAEVNWSGLYAGANVGYGWSTASNQYLSPDGVLGGAQIGYNFQRGPIVFGLETDLEGSDITDSNTFAKSEMNWFGTVRGRLGYAFGKALVFGTAGFAYGNVENSSSAYGSKSETQTGWVAGGGVEYKITPNWSGKVEYQYIDLSAEHPWPGTGALGLGWNNTETQVQTVRVGVNYFFNSSYAPLK